MLFLLDILPFPTVAEIAFDFFSVTASVSRLKGVCRTPQKL